MHLNYREPVDGYGLQLASHQIDEHWILFSGFTEDDLLASSPAFRA